MLIDRPSANAFLIDQGNKFGISIVALTLALLIASGRGNAGLFMLAILVFLVSSAILFVKGLKSWFTRYALTDLRVLRCSGVLKREAVWIPWSKVTDITFQQSLSGRMFGYATVRIESANEASGFRRIKDLRHPHAFHNAITMMVGGQWGKVRPLQ